MALFHQHLYDWYQRHGRKDLPWRNTDDPYAIYISEVMLQQTQVQTVLDRYYAPFLRAFPTLQALADAPLQQVLKQWEGLGYYSRARNLHEAAKATAPHLPETVEGLMALKGIGRNTAHAIAAFAFHQPVPVMEANLKRVLHRLVAAECLSEKELWQLAADYVDAADPFTYNQAMMDIGALICTPAQPQCLLCPLSDICEGKEAPHAYPAPKQKKAVPIRPKVIIVFQDADRYYLTPRTGRFLGGLFGFPEYEPDAPLSFKGTLYGKEWMQLLGSIEQVYSHFRLQAEVFLQQVQGMSQAESEHWYSEKELTALPLSRADIKIVKLLEKLSIAV